MERFAIDCRSVASYEDFIEAFNAGLIRDAGGEWDGNLDAFHDYLSWPKAERYELEILGTENCRTKLGHAAMALELTHRLETCHPTNRTRVAAELERAGQGLGPTLFDVLHEIIQSNAHVQLVLR